MRTKSLLIEAIFVAAIITSSSASAGLSIKGIVKDVGNIAKQVAKLPNPITTPIQIITGNQNPLKPGEYIKQQGQALGSIASSARNITNAPYDAAGQVVSDVAGDKARVVFEIVTGGQRLQNEFAFTAAQQAAGLLQGQDPLVALAMPLAAAIRDAHSKFDGQAQPLPESVKSTLGLIIPSDILNRARYVVGEFKMSLPSVVEIKDKDTAVTLDDIIVFPRNLDFGDIDDLAWISHELYHVRQYRDWGIDQFAFNYLKNYKAVEDQAYAAQSYAESFLMQVAQHKQINPRVTYISTPAFSAKLIQTPLGQTTVLTEQDSNSSPGPLPPETVVQPVLSDARTSGFSGYCVVNHEPILIAKDDTLVAPMRGFAPFGRRQKPGLTQGCYFDLVFPAARACAVEVTSTDASGVTLYGYEVYLQGQNVGRCAACTSQTCPQ